MSAKAVAAYNAKQAALKEKAAQKNEADAKEQAELDQAKEARAKALKDASDALNAAKSAPGTTADSIKALQLDVNQKKALLERAVQRARTILVQRTSTANVFSTLSRRLIRETYFSLVTSREALLYSISWYLMYICASPTGPPKITSLAHFNGKAAHKEAEGHVTGVVKKLLLTPGKVVVPSGGEDERILKLLAALYNKGTFGKMLAAMSETEAYEIVVKAAKEELRNPGEGGSGIPEAVMAHPTMADLRASLNPGDEVWLESATSGRHAGRFKDVEDGGGADDGGGGGGGDGGDGEEAVGGSSLRGEGGGL